VIDDIMSRLATITDNTGASVAYKYLGAGTIVEEDHYVGAKLSYLDSNGNVTGLDRFGRIRDQIWTDFAAAEIDHYRYEYDRAGNRVTKLNELNHDLDESYVYDEVDRLKAWYVDDVLQEEWNLDALGNDLAAGTYNAANEETPTGQTGNSYDAAGNMITLQSG
jgi:YD repeat-containing protein